MALTVDLGFHVFHKGPFRLAGCNARELHDPGGREAADHLGSLLLPGTAVVIRSLKAGPIPDDKYAPRYDCAVTLDGTDLVTQLVAEHWAIAWDGTGTRPVPPWPRPEDIAATVSDRLG